MSEFEFDVDLEDSPVAEATDLEIVGEDIYLGPGAVPEGETIKEGIAATITVYERLTDTAQAVFEDRIPGIAGNGRIVRFVTGLSGVELDESDPSNILITTQQAPFSTPSTWEELYDVVNASAYIRVKTEIGTGDINFNGHSNDPQTTYTFAGGVDAIIAGVGRERYDMIVSPHGDLAAVRGVALAKQSVIREIINNPGSFPRRPEWGAGLNGLLFKGATQSVRDRITTRARAKMLANPRVKRVLEITTSIEDGGIKLFVRVETIGGLLEDKIVIKPPGVS